MTLSWFSRLKLNPRWLLALLGLGAIALAWKLLPLADWLQGLLVWVKSLGGWGPVAFIALYNLATILLIPGSLLTLGGGVLFGLGWGSVYVFGAAVLGATWAFLIGRYWARHWVAEQIQANPKFQAIDQAVAREGLKIVFLTRLSPVFPFNLLNYAFGITQVRLRDYVLGSVGMLPGTVLYVYLGSLAGNLATLGTMPSGNESVQTAQWAVKIVGLLATIAVTVSITRMAKQALNQTVVTGEAAHDPVPPP